MGSPADVLGLLADSPELLPARSQMAFTLGFHIILACLGVAFPAITLIANWRGLRQDDEAALTLARRWSKVMAVLFAVGAVTGTVLSFEMGLLWPGLMDRYGEVFGVPFAIEGIFFFTEAIFIAIYIYGWDAAQPVGALLVGRADRDRRPRRRAGGGVGELVDEPAPRVHAGRRAARDRRGRARGDLQRRDALRGAAHDPGRLHGRRLPGGVRVRGGDAARAPRPLPPARVR